RKVGAAQAGEEAAQAGRVRRRELPVPARRGLLDAVRLARLSRSPPPRPDREIQAAERPARDVAPGSPEGDRDLLAAEPGASSRLAEPVPGRGGRSRLPRLSTPGAAAAGARFRRRGQPELRPTPGRSLPGRGAPAPPGDERRAVVAASDADRAPRRDRRSFGFADPRFADRRSQGL